MGCSFGRRTGENEALQQAVEALTNELRVLHKRLEPIENSVELAPSPVSMREQCGISIGGKTAVTSANSGPGLTVPGQVFAACSHCDANAVEDGDILGRIKNLETIKPYLMAASSVRPIAGPPSGTATHVFRQNICTDQWVVIATGMGDKPRSYVPPEKADKTHTRVSYLSTCPFCKGNEAMCAEEAEPPILNEHAADSTKGRWVLRVINNKFPYISPTGNAELTFDGIHPQITAVGRHEVIIESDQHNSCIAFYELPHVHALLACVQRRGKALSHDARVTFIKYIQNHGAKAGGSLHHPHMQIIALPLVPPMIVHRFNVANNFWVTNNTCCFCAVLQQEIEHGSRIVCQNKHFVAFVPFAPRSSHHVWIVPRRHCHSFLDATDEELAACGEMLQNVLKQIYYGFGDPDYNVAIRSAPCVFEGLDLRAYFHWYLTVHPHLSEDANFKAFEMCISSTLPEVAANQLREFEGKPLVEPGYSDQDTAPQCEAGKLN